MRILHCPINIAGQPYAYVLALRRKGIDAELLVFKEGPLQQGYDYSLGFDGIQSRLIKWLRLWQSFVRLAPRYDLFHYHTNVTLLHPFHWDLPILKAMGKKVVCQFWGSDIRGQPPDKLAFLRHADAIIVGSYHMLDYVPDGAHVVLPGLDLRQWPSPEPRKGQEIVRVVHAPSKRKVKGTEHVLHAVDILRSEGLPFEFVLIEGVPNDQAREIYRTCDIAVDQLLGGWYGIFALETMAMGKAVMGYIKPENADRLMAARQVRPPLVSASPSSLADELEKLIKDGDRRIELGRLSRSYIEQLHDIDKSAEQVLTIYRQLRSQPRGKR
jgi:glycosyltransferase involved in cell wall biosynthesis